MPEIDQGITALVMIGRGQMIFDPAPEAEKTQVRIFSAADVLERTLRRRVPAHQSG